MMWRSADALQRLLWHGDSRKHVGSVVPLLPAIGIGQKSFVACRCPKLSSVCWQVAVPKAQCPASECCLGCLLSAACSADDSLRLTSTDTDADTPSSSDWASAPSSSDTAESITSLTSLSSSDESSGSTMAERLQARYEQKQQASSGVVAFKLRQQRRQDYMEQVGQVREGTCQLALLCCLHALGRYSNQLT